METGNDILERMLKCFDIIDNLSVEEKQALADEYWNFADRRNAYRNAHQGGAEIDTKTWEGLSVKYPLEAVQTPKAAKVTTARACYFNDKMTVKAIESKWILCSSVRTPSGDNLREPKNSSLSQDRSTLAA